MQKPRVQVWCRVRSKVNKVSAEFPSLKWHQLLTDKQMSFLIVALQSAGRLCSPHSLMEENPYGSSWQSPVPVSCIHCVPSIMLLQEGLSFLAVGMRGHLDACEYIWWVMWTGLVVRTSFVSIASLPSVSRGWFQCTVLQGFFLPCLVISGESTWTNTLKSVPWTSQGLPLCCCSK